MFASLSARLVGIGFVVIAALAFLAGLLTDAAYQTSKSFSWVIHSAEVIETSEDALSNLREAESGQRGFILTHNPIYARTFSERVAGSAKSIAWVVHLTEDNPLQHRRASELAGLIQRRSAVLQQPLNLGQKGDFTQATAVIASGRGRELMDEIAIRAQAFLDDERRLQTDRSVAAEHRLASGKWSALIGAAVVAMLVLIGLGLLILGIRRPLAIMMQAMNELGSGRGGARIDAAMGSKEFGQLAQHYNAMADRLVTAVADRQESEQRLQIANAELQQNGEALRERGTVIELLGGMAHRMQGARTDDELADIIRVFVPQVLPGLPGALYAHNNSRNLLALITGWGGMESPREGFAPDECWALRRGQSHCVTARGHDIVCAHILEDEIYHCEPLLAGGEVIGILCLRGLVSTENRFRLTVLTENIASALVNHRLQRSLREQTIRDPLTGLFNRRYMEETLMLEIARVSRSGEPLGVVMCDIDYFKRFNDEFGHDAGDAVLQAVASEMRRRFRDGDVICRYGGEEFIIIAPGTTAEALMARVELVRLAIGDLNVRQNGRTLGTTSMSFGIATWTNSMAKDGSTLVQAADAALYDAKRTGRNRTSIFGLAA